MKLGAMVNLYMEYDKLHEIVDTVSAEEFRELFKQLADQHNKLKDDVLRLLHEIGEIKLLDLDTDEIIRLIDERADRLDFSGMGMNTAEAAWREVLRDLWDRLDYNSQIYLITSLLIETILGDTNGDLAPAVIEMGRAFENELQKKIYIEYIHTISQRDPALTDSDSFYNDIEKAVRDYKSNRKYFISAIRMMKYIGTLSNNRDDNVRVFKRELRRFLNGKSSNIRELSNSRKVSDACEYIDTFRNGAAHPDPSDRPENYWSEHIGECKTKTEEVLRYFLTNVGNA